MFVAARQRLDPPVRQSRFRRFDRRNFKCEARRLLLGMTQPGGRESHSDDRNAPLQAHPLEILSLIQSHERSIPRTSNLEPRTSNPRTPNPQPELELNLEPRTSNLEPEPRTSNPPTLEPRTSNLEPRTSNSNWVPGHSHTPAPACRCTRYAMLAARAV